MNKDYRIKIGRLYVEYIDTNCYCGNTSFIEKLKLTCDKKESDTYYEEDIESVAKIIEDVLSTEVTIEED